MMRYKADALGFTAFFMLQAVVSAVSYLYRDHLFVYIIGWGHDINGNVTEGVTSSDMYFWMLNLALFCILVLRRIFIDSGSYMYFWMSRQKDILSGLNNVIKVSLIKTSLFTFLLIGGAFTGTCTGLWISDCDKSNNIKVLFKHNFIGKCIADLYFGYILFVLSVIFCFFYLRSVKFSLIVFPGIPLISVIVGDHADVRICNLLPGSWLMANKSSAAVAGGYDNLVICIIEIILSLLIYAVMVINKKRIVNRW